MAIGDSENKTLDPRQLTMNASELRAECDLAWNDLLFIKATPEDAKNMPYFKADVWPSKAAREFMAKGDAKRVEIENRAGPHRKDNPELKLHLTFALLTLKTIKANVATALKNHAFNAIQFSDQPTDQSLKYALNNMALEKLVEESINEAALSYDEQGLGKKDKNQPWEDKEVVPSQVEKEVVISEVEKEMVPSEVEKEIVISQVEKEVVAPQEDEEEDEAINPPEDRERNEIVNFHSNPQPQPQNSNWKPIGKNEYPAWFKERYREDNNHPGTFYRNIDPPPTKPAIIAHDDKFEVLDKSEEVARDLVLLAKQRGATEIMVDGPGVTPEIAEMYWKQTVQQGMVAKILVGAQPWQPSPALQTQFNADLAARDVQHPIADNDTPETKALLAESNEALKHLKETALNQQQWVELSTNHLRAVSEKYQALTDEELPKMVQGQSLQNALPPLDSHVPNLQKPPASLVSSIRKALNDSEARTMDALNQALEIAATEGAKLEEFDSRLPDYEPSLLAKLKEKVSNDFEEIKQNIDTRLPTTTQIEELEQSVNKKIREIQYEASIVGALHDPDNNITLRPEVKFAIFAGKIALGPEALKDIGAIIAEYKKHGTPVVIGIVDSQTTKSFGGGVLAGDAESTHCLINKGNGRLALAEREKMNGAIKGVYVKVDGSGKVTLFEDQGKKKEVLINSAGKIEPKNVVAELDGQSPNTKKKPGRAH
ncbi:MAG: hypothetical protein V4568_20335 [Pseudomonadota bacterium]